MRRPLPVATAVLTAVLTTVTVAGCTAEAEPPAEIAVSGEPGSAPELEYDVPLDVAEPRVEVVWEGEGPEVQDGEPVLVDYYAETGEDGSLLNETYTRDPKSYVLSAEALGGDIYEALRGRTVGSRILQVVPAGDGQASTTVAVFDLLPTRATGEAVEPRADVPQVTLGDDGEPTITVPEAAAPTELVVQPLIRGAGPQVHPGQVITVQYTGVRWSDGSTFDSTWAPGEVPTNFPIGVGQVVAGWDEGLVEQTVGSQVLLVVPPALGYGGTDHELAEETLVFVVDILAASGGPEIED